MKILAIDPGPEQSAWATYETAMSRDDGRTWGVIQEFGKIANEGVVEWLHNARYGKLAIEMIASYGMPVGREVFETCVWIGRFVEAWTRSNCEGGGEHPALVYRRDVKLHLCGSPRAKDANVRQALLDRWGGKDKAVGTKKQPGPLYGVKADIWAALAVAVTFADTRSDCPPPHRQPDPSHSAGEA